MIDGRIVRIFDDRTVAINIGSLAGVRPGMRFGIYTPYEDVVDPETKSSLGRTRRRKAIVVASAIHDLFTVAVAPTRHIQSAAVALSAFTSRDEQQDSLPVAKSDVQPYETGLEIRLGDRVEQLEPQQRRPQTPGT